ncbi:MAG: YidC/Oxa1 family insertase periplasmic-domain containing protein [Phycisphaerales bacterium]|nr:YidC/Oxa1 family insertase periplasmic-domain containing protein [Phycisphaerales bacterium]
MDNRRLLLVMLLMLPLILVWEPLWVFIGRQLGYDMTRRPPTTQVATGDASVAPLPPSAPVEPGPESPDGRAAISAVEAPQEDRLVSLGSANPGDPRFAVQVRLNSRGAGIDAVLLNDYQVDVDNPSRYTFQTPYSRFVNASRPMGSISLRFADLAGQEGIDLAGLNWTLDSSDERSARWSLLLRGEDGRKLRLTKTYAIAPRGESKDTHRGFEIAVTLGVENVGQVPVVISKQFNGPVMPPKELDRGSDRTVIGGYLEAGKVLRIRHDYLESFSASNPSIDYSRGEDGEPMLWAGANSVYFNAILRPDPLAAPQTLTPEYVARVEAVALAPDNPEPAGRDVVVRFHTAELALAPGQSVAMPMRFFVGPRLRSLMNNDYLGRLPLKYNETLVLTAGPCAWCTFQWLVNLLVWLLGVVHFVVRDWGISIIVLVLIVRALLHPITKKAQVNMMAMSKFGPEIERLKKKYGDNKEELNRAMVQFYKEHGATPILGCLPMFLQMPIWIALFSALQSTFELRQAPFLQIGGVNLTWIKDLSQPDHLIKLDQPFNFLFIPISGLNILPFLLAVVFWLQHKMTPKPPAMTPEQEQQQKMMQWMTLLFPVFLYGGPSGLNLYILASTTFGIIESKIIRDHIKRKEEAEKAGAVIVDADSAPRGRRTARHASAAGGESDSRPQGWLARKLTEMQKRVEELQQQADRQKKKRRT